MGENQENSPIAIPPQVSPPSSNPRRDLSRLEGLYTVHRDYIKFEHELQNHRSTWHILMQGFLFATLGVIGEWPIGKGLPVHLAVEREVLPYILMSAGSLIAFACLASVLGAELAIRGIARNWTTQANTEFDPDFIKRVPHMRGGGNSQAPHLGEVASLAIPMVAFFAWLGVAIMFHLDKRESQNQGNKAVQTADGESHPSNRFLLITTRTHQDIAIDQVTGTFCKTWDWQPRRPKDKLDPIYALRTCDEIYQDSLKEKH